MIRTNSCRLPEVTIQVMVVLMLAVPLALASESATTTRAASKIRGVLLTADHITANRIRQLSNDGFTSIAVLVEGASKGDAEARRRAAGLVATSELQLYYWIEVARCAELADAHPDWMASLQTHNQWRRYFPDTPRPAAHEVVKTYPWVPILAREPFAAQLRRVKTLLDGLPRAGGVFLNDLQGAPSACGCGNPLCRWTSDYGQRRTTTPLGDDAAALFVDAVKKFIPDSSVIPVWTTECEQQDGADDGLCAGVGCFDGICWKAYTRQLMPLAQTSSKLGVLVPFREFQRELPIYGEKTGWIGHAIASFSKMPPKHGGRKIPSSRLIAVLQGWDVTPAEVASQIRMTNQSKVLGYFVAYAKIEQSWQPKIVRWR